MIDEAKRLEIARISRFVINGFVATGVNYAVLKFNLLILDIPSAGIAGFIANVFGIAASFIGSRHFVFDDAQTPWKAQALRFVALYGVIAGLCAYVLHVWTDLAHYNVDVGWFITQVLQVACSYVGSKTLVFRK